MVIGDWGLEVGTYGSALELVDAAPPGPVVPGEAVACDHPAEAAADDGDAAEDAQQVDDAETTDSGIRGTGFGIAGALLGLFGGALAVVAVAQLHDAVLDIILGSAATHGWKW